MAKLLRDFVRVENDFTIIPNEILRNKEMKSSVKNILLTMLSLPPEWDFSISGIATVVTESKDTVQKALIELEKIGYITRKRERKDSGTFGAMIYTIHQFPVSKEKNTYKKNFDNQDVKEPVQENTNIGKKPTLDFQSQLRTDNKLNIDSKLRKDDELNTDNKAFSKEKVSYKVFSSQSEEKIGEQHLPYNYNLDEFRVFIEGKIYVLAREIDPDIPDRDIKAISDIIVYFYDRYFKVMGRRHPILKDDVYERILLSMMHPPRPVDEGDKYNIYAYEDMIDHFFETDYGKCSGNRTDYKLPYFFAKKVFENLCWKGFYIGFDDPDQRE